VEQPGLGMLLADEGMQLREKVSLRSTCPAVLALHRSVPFADLALRRQILFFSRALPFRMLTFFISLLIC